VNRNGHDPWLDWVFVYAMTAVRPDENPTVLFNQPDDISIFHRLLSLIFPAAPSGGNFDADKLD
jgi:hypothetical protein